MTHPVHSAADNAV